MHEHILDVLEVAGAALVQKDFQIQSLKYQLEETKKELERYKQVYEAIKQEAKGKCK